MEMVRSRWAYRAVNAVWWISVLWLSLTGCFIVKQFIEWMTEPENPGRYELAIVAAMGFLYSWPAVVGVLVAALTPKTGLSVRRRAGGVSLLMFCIALLVLFDFLQARYR